MTVPMLMMPPPAVQTRFRDWPFAVKSILGFWLFYALTVVVRAFLGSDPWTTVENKLVVVGIGIVINGLIYLAIAALGERQRASAARRSLPAISFAHRLARPGRRRDHRPKT